MLEKSANQLTGATINKNATSANLNTHDMPLFDTLFQTKMVCLYEKIYLYIICLKNIISTKCRS
jgi:hypothetical protein